MSSRRFRTLLLSALAVVLVGTGCGGGSGNDGETTTSSIGKGEFIKKANAICAKDGEKMHADFLAFSSEHNNNPNPSKAEYEEFVNSVIEPDMKQQIADIRTLGTPTGDEGQTEEIFEAVEEGLQRSKEQPELVTTSNSEFFGRAIKLANEYGLAVCAQSY